MPQCSEQQLIASRAAGRICALHGGLEDLRLVDGRGATMFGAEMTAQDDADAALASGATDVVRERLVAVTATRTRGERSCIKKAQRRAVPTWHLGAPWMSYTRRREAGRRSSAPATSATSAAGRTTMPIRRRSPGCSGISRRRSKPGRRVTRRASREQGLLSTTNPATVILDARLSLRILRTRTLAP
jgi:hypothetical protein